jgi:hypothetical protein
MNRKPGRKLEKLKPRFLETERTGLDFKTVIFLGLTRPLLTGIKVLIAFSNLDSTTVDLYASDCESFAHIAAVVQIV